MRKLSHITILDEYAVDMNVVLGQGSTGCVYQGLNMKTSAKVAVKIIDLRTIDNEVARYLLNMEKNAIMSVNSPFVLKGFKATEDSRYCFIITQFCNGGTLKRYIRNSPEGYLSQQKSLQIIRQILQGYKSLVDKGIVHRDLKPANIMLHNDIPKIIDFGYCQIKGYTKPTLQYNVGSPSYMAPESFQRNVYNEKTQIWAIGVILFQCVTGKTIDEGRHMSQVYKEIEVLGVPYPHHVSYLVRNVINWCLSKNPSKRPTCQQLLQAYFTKHHRSKSKLSPFKSDIQPIRQSTTPFLNQRMSLYNHPKILKQKSPNKQKLHHTDIDNLFKSARIDQTKAKNYKMPQFLQSNAKVKKQTSQNKQNMIKTTHVAYEQPKQSRDHYRIKPSKSTKNHHKVCEDRLICGRTTAAWEYGGYGEVKQYHEAKKKLNIDEMYKKLCKEGQMTAKNRILSTHFSPGTAKMGSPAKYLTSTPSTQVIRKKRTFTERAGLLRA